MIKNTAFVFVVPEDSAEDYYKGQHIVDSASISLQDDNLVIWQCQLVFRKQAMQKVAIDSHILRQKEDDFDNKKYN